MLKSADYLQPIPDNRQETFLIQYDGVIKSMTEEFLLSIMSNKLRYIDNSPNEMHHIIHTLYELTYNRLKNSINEPIRYHKWYFEVSLFSIHNYIKTHCSIHTDETHIRYIIDLFYQIRIVAPMDKYTQPVISMGIYNFLQQPFTEKLYIVMEHEPNTSDRLIINSLAVGNKEIDSKLILVTPENKDDDLFSLTTQLFNNTKFTSLMISNSELLRKLMNDINKYPFVEDSLIMLLHRDTSISFDYNENTIGNFKDNISDEIKKIISDKLLRTKFSAVYPLSEKTREMLGKI